MKIRKAIVADVLQLVRLGAKFYEQTPYYKTIPYSISTTTRLAQACINCGLFFVAEDEGKIVGMLGGIETPFILNSAFKVGTELFWFVEDKYRKSNVGFELLQAIEQAAKDKGLKYWTMMSLETHDPERVGKYYQSMGYKPVEHSFKKDL